MNENCQTVIYGFGVAGRWAADNLDNVVAIVDTDLKKWGMKHNHLMVQSPDVLKDFMPENTQIVITTVDIFDVLPLLHSYGLNNYCELGSQIDLTNLGSNKTGESDEFLLYTLHTVKLCHENYLNSNSFFIRSVDLIITEKCTLKCVDCANLMQFYESPQNISLESSISDVQGLLEKCDSINEVRVIGGEPFLNKDIHRLIPFLSAAKNIQHVVIYTNGMVPLKDEFLSIYKHPKVVFSITDYGDLARHTKGLVEKLSANGIAYRLHPPEYWTDSGKVKDFSRSEEDMKRLFAKCCGKNLYSVAEGKLYRCPFVANADRLNAIPHDIRNFVRIDATADELRHYCYGIDYIPACNFCNGRSFDAPGITPAVQTKHPITYIRHDNG
jgi:organic radical activating enzyme